MTIHRPAPLAAEPSDIADIFSVLVERWRSETGHLSIVQQKVMNRTYLEIIGLGRPALPLLLGEIQRRPAHWFLALSSIARENPVRPGASFDDAVQDWLTWGRSQGLIS
jgi:hypothetical protein